MKDKTSIQKKISIVLDILIAVSLFLFLASAGFRDSRTSGWYRQYFPNLNGSSITGITFLDSLTGYAVTSVNSAYQGYILKTINGGDNWTIKFTYNPPYNNVSFNKIQFVDNNIGYASINYVDLIKTTNGGENWFTIFTDLYPEDMSVINKDTILAVKSNGFNGGVYRTTNGGYNWQLIWDVGGGSGNPYSIYMFNKNLGFSNSGTYVRRTTNGGVNWTDVSGGGGYSDIKFIDSLTGWKYNNNIKKTTDGGLTWIQQILPTTTSFSGSGGISILNKDSIWMVGGYKLINGFYYGMIYKTTNGGLNWGYQILDTSIHIGAYYFVQFKNQRNGWAFSYELGNDLIHTKVGGNDTTYFTGINNQVSDIPAYFALYQNYPNPFNSTKNKV